MKTLITISLILLCSIAVGQTGTLKLDTTSSIWGTSVIILSPPTVYDTIPSWLLTTTREDLATMTQRKGYAIKPREISDGITYGYYRPSELKTIAYLDANKKPVTDFIVWMSLQRKED